jgi:hypothetical protein
VSRTIEESAGYGGMPVDTEVERVDGNQFSDAAVHRYKL